LALPAGETKAPQFQTSSTPANDVPAMVKNDVTSVSR
jgi:hypothetical protein